MAVLKTRSRRHDGTGYNDVLHYETQAKQVKVLDSNGEAKSDLEEMILKGKTLTGISLSTVLDTGLYQVIDCTDAPFVLPEGKEFLMTVDTVGQLSRQTFFDSDGVNNHIRPIYNGTVGSWIVTGEQLNTDIALINSVIGEISLLNSTDKTNLVSALNEIDAKANSNSSSISDLTTRLAELKEDFSAHNHDNQYLKRTGGDLSGSATVPNNVSFQAKNTSGDNLNVSKIDASNNVVIGDASANGMTVNAKGGNLSLFDGANIRKVFHSGNMGKGSGLDADSVDGVDGILLARRDIRNYFLQDQYIDDGKSIQIRASAGESQAGSVFFRDGDNVQKGRILTGVDNSMRFYAGSTRALELQESGDMISTNDHVMNAAYRQVALRFKLSDSDKGAGFYMNGTSKQVGFYDWEYGGSIFRTDRDDQTVKFTNEIFIQGHRLSIRTSAPSNPSTGDIWFDI